MTTGKLKLCEPIQVGNLTLKNRFKQPAMAVSMNVNEEISDQYLAFYAERARGGVAMIGISCTGSRLIDDPMLGLYDDKFIPGLKKVVDTIHKNGALCYAQVGVGYSWAFGDDGPVELISPSGMSLTGKPGTPFRMGGPWEPTMPRELTVEEIHIIEKGYAEAARRAKEAGFDAFEIIPAVSYVGAQFMSTLLNKRKDQYGGSIENRFRFTREIVDEIGNKVGRDFPVTARISGADLLEPSGYGVEDAKRMGSMLEEVGVKQIDLMSGWHYSSVPILQTTVPQGNWAYFAEAVKSVVKIPVAAGTQIQDVLTAERVLQEGKADMIYMARALIADPELPNKAREGRLQDIRPCINCCRCIEASDKPPVYCSVNPRMGREAEYPVIKAAEKKKRVLVVGGGPGGMEAARVAHLKGHDVTLCEQNRRLGGALLLASVANIRMEPFMKFKVREIENLPIDVKLNTEVTPAFVKKMKPDVLIIAAGGAGAPFNVPGVDSDIVLARSDLQAFFRGQPMKKGGFIQRTVSLCGAIFSRYYYNPSFTRWFMQFNFPFKKRVAIIGGSYAGVELGELLTDRGKKVSIIEESKRMGYNIGTVHRWSFLAKLQKEGVKMMTNTKVIEIVKEGVKVDTGKAKELVEADTVVNVKMVSNTELTKQLEGLAKTVHVLGDAAEPGLVMEAVTSGFMTGEKLV